ncbi:MAG: hypothetical protein K2G31_05485, partial [Clostridia bacterium]|nr:hypothetical protein [Clostridia bacterium]
RKYEREYNKRKEKDAPTFTLGCAAKIICSRRYNIYEEKYVYTTNELFKKYVEATSNIDKNCIEKKLTELCEMLSGKDEISKSLVDRRNDCAHQEKQDKKLCDESFDNVINFFKLWKEIFHD